MTDVSENTQSFPASASPTCSALWEPVYGGSILHSWEWKGGRTWATRCGKSVPIGRAKFNAKKCTKCLEAEAQNARIKPRREAASA